MTTSLPDTTGLLRVSSDDWRAFAQCLGDIGFNADYLRRIWPSDFRIYERLQNALRLRAARLSGEPAALAYRALILRDPIRRDEASSLFGRDLVDRLVEAGLFAQPRPDQLVSRFDCRFFRGLILLCDDLSHLGNVVFGAGPGTEAFTGLSSRSLAVDRVLELGCGAGGAAIWLAKHARHVIATDINERALDFVRINAAINGIVNVEPRAGDLFDPVGSERFDLITAQLPFVPTPPDAQSALFRDGGPVGTELLCKLFSQLPAHLAPKGRAVVVLEYPAFEGASDASPVEFPPMPGAGALFIRGAAVPADEYSIRNAAQYLREGLEAFDEAAVTMRNHLADVNLSAVHPAVCVVARSDCAEGWIELLDTSSLLWDQLVDGAVDRLFDGHELLHAGRRAGADTIGIPPDSVVLRRYSVSGKDSGTVYLALPQRHLVPSLQLTNAEWETLSAAAAGGSAEVSPDLVECLLRAGLHGS